MTGKVVLTIDCGETATHICVANTDNIVISERKKGAIWRQHFDETEIVTEINRIIIDTCKESGYGFDKVASIVIVIPGIDRTSDENPIVRELKDKWKRRKYTPDNISVIHAPILALEIFYPRQPAVFALCDNKSFVVARNSRNKFIQAGGWGTAIPDPGSADAIVAKVLRYIAEVYDERAINSPFFKTITDRLSIDTPARFFKSLNNKAIVKDALIDATFKTAEGNDIAANSFLDSAADEFVDMIRHVAAPLPVSKRIPIMLHGRLFDESKKYTTIIRRKLSAILPHLTVSTDKFSVSECAMQYAIQIAGSSRRN